jgi:pimeloyl-ACP methyl ester carboxylesterase
MADITKTKNGTPIWITGEGPPLILVHGVLMDHRMWAGQVAMLSDNYRVICLDMLGHGDAPNPLGERTLADFTGQIEEVIAECCADTRPVLGGFSMGGLITQAFGAKRHSDLAGLIILNAVYDRTPNEAALVRDRSKMMVAEGVKATVDGARARWFREDEVATHGAMIEEICGWMEDGDFSAKCKAHWVFATSDDQVAGSLGNISCPTLIMTGDGDAGSTPQMSEAMAHAIPNSELHILDRQQHMMPVLDATRVTGLMRGFLDRAAF